MGVVVSKRRPRSLLLIIPRLAGDVPVHSGTSGAGGRATNRSRPAAAHDWEEGACDQAKGVGRVSCGQEVSRAGRSSLSARSARLTSCPCRWPHCCSDFLVKRVGRKSDRATAGIIGGGATAKATRPTGGLTLTRQKEPTGEFLPNPPSPDRHGCAYAQELPLAGGPGTPGINTRRSPDFSASLSAVRCCPAGAVSSSACPGLTLWLCGVAFGHPRGVLC